MYVGVVQATLRDKSDTSAIRTQNLASAAELIRRRGNGNAHVPVEDLGMGIISPGGLVSPPPRRGGGEPGSAAAAAGGGEERPASAVGRAPARVPHRYYVRV